MSFEIVRVNLGCGWRNFGKDWYHVDGGDYEHLDSNDIFNLPFNDNSVDLIYASHIIGYYLLIDDSSSSKASKR